MTLPDKFKVVVITLSDRASKGEYEDRSGPEIVKSVTEFFNTLSWDFEISYILMPDNAEELKETLRIKIPASDIVFTTGGTGIGPNDITVETVKPFLTKEIPGIMELIRVKYGMQKPAALISCAVAGVSGMTLVYTLPGSVRAVQEYMNEIVPTLEHSFYMLYNIDRHR